MKPEARVGGQDTTSRLENSNKTDYRWFLEEVDLIRICAADKYMHNNFDRKGDTVCVLGQYICR